MKKKLSALSLSVASFLLGGMQVSAETVTELDSLGGVIAAGGIALKVIFALSAVALFLVVYFLLSLRASVLMPSAFLEEASEAVRDGDVEALRTSCRNNGSAASRIMAAATEQIVVTGRTDYLAVRDAVEDEGARQAGALWQRLQYMMDIAAVAPMVGLLGTVFGMLESFSGMKTEVGAVRPDTLAQGVSKALITTAGGLIVGIAALILYAIFRGRVAQLVARLEEQCGTLLRQLVAGKTETGGK